MSLNSPKTSGLSLFDRLFAYMDSLRPSDRFIFVGILAVFLISSIWSLYLFSRGQLVNVPSSGGTLIEGAIGSPRFINPVLAITRADNDLASLTYSGLLRLTPEGTLENDLAESITISEDGLVYNIILKPDNFFHDGTRVRAEDVAFTISLVQKPDIKSPQRGNWNGISVEVVDIYELNLIIESPYPPFKENLTLGILPKHIWSRLSDEELPFSHYNTEPVGSGLYRVAEVKHNSDGLVSEYNLVVTDQHKDKTNIKDIVFLFYQNEEALITALKKGEVSSTSYLGEHWLSLLDKEQFQFISEPLPRVFSIFFNQNKSPVVRDKAVRQALDTVIDREELVANVVKGYGKIATTPVPTDLITTLNNEVETLSSEERLVRASDILVEGGWEKTDTGRWIKEIDGVETPLQFTVRSSNGVLFENLAEHLSSSWKQLGAEITFEFYEQSDLTQTIIRPRDYQALLFGVDIGRGLDIYPFWHSSGREDPGLNVSLHTNIIIDKLVSDIRLSTSTTERDQLIAEFTKQIAIETPSIPLFTPTFDYVTIPNVHVTEMKKIQKANERFSNITDWYMNEAMVWTLFSN